jgi:chromosome segregation ATPase
MLLAGCVDKVVDIVEERKIELCKKQLVDTEKLIALFEARRSELTNIISRIDGSKSDAKAALVAEDHAELLRARDQLNRCDEAIRKFKLDRDEYQNELNGLTSK